MSDDPLIPASPSEDDYVRQLAAAEPPALLGGDDPFALFAEWLHDADHSEPNDPNAMALATVDASGLPDVRMVLLKGFDPSSVKGGGFTFFTNLDSAKGRELGANPQAALLFHWKSLRRQVRVRGAVQKVSDEEADAYFATRARPSQIGAWASEQSRELPSRHALEMRIAEYAARFGIRKVPRPPHWSGYRLVPQSFEFWRDRPFRLHERLVFEAGPEGWSTKRLYP
jgi:pyridoxamine 5'-phosphate oxidase